MHADDFVRAVGQGRYFGDGNGRSVGGKNYLRTADAVEITKDLGFDFKFFRCRFDYEIALSEFFTIKDAFHTL